MGLASAQPTQLSQRVFHAIAEGVSGGGGKTPQLYLLPHFL